MRNKVTKRKHRAVEVEKDSAVEAMPPEEMIDMDNAAANVSEFDIQSVDDDSRDCNLSVRGRKRRKSTRGRENIQGESCVKPEKRLKQTCQEEDDDVHAVAQHKSDCSQDVVDKQSNESATESKPVAKIDIDDPKIIAICTENWNEQTEILVKFAEIKKSENGDTENFPTSQENGTCQTGVTEIIPVSQENGTFYSDVAESFPESQENGISYSGKTELFSELANDGKFDTCDTEEVLEDNGNLDTCEKNATESEFLNEKQKEKAVESTEVSEYVPGFGKIHNDCSVTVGFYTDVNAANTQLAEVDTVINNICDLLVDYNKDLTLEEKSSGLIKEQNQMDYAEQSVTVVPDSTTETFKDTKCNEDYEQEDIDQTNDDEDKPVVNLDEQSDDEYSDIDQSNYDDNKPVVNLDKESEEYSNVKIEENEVQQPENTFEDISVTSVPGSFIGNGELCSEFDKSFSDMSFSSCSNINISSVIQANADFDRKEKGNAETRNEKSENKCGWVEVCQGNEKEIKRNEAEVNCSDGRPVPCTSDGETTNGSDINESSKLKQGGTDQEGDEMNLETDLSDSQLCALWSSQMTAVPDKPQNGRRTALATGSMAQGTVISTNTTKRGSMALPGTALPSRDTGHVVQSVTSRPTTSSCQSAAKPTTSWEPGHIVQPAGRPTTSWEPGHVVQSVNKKVQDGSAIMAGLIKEVSLLNKMILKTKREIELARRQNLSIPNF